MEKRRLSEFVTFLPGKNQTRAGVKASEENIIYYDQVSFDSDLKNYGGFIDRSPTELSDDSVAVKAGDVVISNSLQLATVVGDLNAGKILSLNFTKVEFSTEGLDRFYFVYLFNSYTDVQRQKERELQGTGLIRRIPMKALVNITIPIIDLEKQKKIGRIYSESLRLKSSLERYAELTEHFIHLLLEENLKEKKDGGI